MKHPHKSTPIQTLFMVIPKCKLPKCPSVNDPIYEKLHSYVMDIIQK